MALALFSPQASTQKLNCEEKSLNARVIGSNERSHLALWTTKLIFSSNSSHETAVKNEIAAIRKIVLVIIAEIELPALIFLMKLITKWEQLERNSCDNIFRKELQKLLFSENFSSFIPKRQFIYSKITVNLRQLQAPRAVSEII